jgi:hypothetical protein
MALRASVWFHALLFPVACAPKPSAQPVSAEEPNQSREHADWASGTSASPSEHTDAPAADPASSSTSGDAPEISRSLGVEGGAVVLWPRIVLPRSGPPKPDVSMRALGADVQRRLAMLVQRAAPGHPVDVRPEPERVCPRAGCTGVSVGALLTRAGNGCAAVALVSLPGVSPARLVPWAGQIRLSAETAPFREPPERAVAVTDYVQCHALLDALNAQDAEVQAAIGRAFGGQSAR